MAAVTITATHVRPLDGCQTRRFVSNEAMNIGDVVQVASDGEIEMANATTAAGANGLLGIVVAGANANKTGAIAAGEVATVAYWGMVYLGENAALDETKFYFVGTTDGDLDDVAPANERIVGVPASTTVFFVGQSTVPANSLA